ncbi:hypothetical protein VL20_1981 [Microcystis panniformis FACHB-1757]|uniref:Uncharacterized protein n=1 Tax=Microcystis panniformis FACHB-1757 TaxID=1638788 RepID=A0A0K1RZ84_9CHRO|nr:hypothetical protein VL20_1981 [Microcystis panniformis FACHB-1757]
MGIAVRFTAARMSMILWSDFIPRKGEYLVEKCSGGIHPTF